MTIRNWEAWFRSEGSQFIMAPLGIVSPGMWNARSEFGGCNVDPGRDRRVVDFQSVPVGERFSRYARALLLCDRIGPEGPVRRSVARAAGWLHRGRSARAHILSTRSARTIEAPALETAVCRRHVGVRPWSASGGAAGAESDLRRRSSRLAWSHLACSPAPPGRKRWTLRLLAEKGVELATWASSGCR